MYITLEEVKKHLRINEDVKEHDSLIEGYVIPAAEGLIAEKLRMKPEELATIRGGEEIPALLKMAMLLAAGTYFANAEDVSPQNIREIPHGVDEIINLFHEIAL